MKKHLALAIGFIVCSAMLLTPFAGAFADSDPGISIAVLNATFNWYTGFPGANENGWLGSTQFPEVSAVCNGQTKYTGLTGYIDLLQAGDYVDYGQNIDTLSSYNTPIWCAEFLIDQAYDFNIDAAIVEVYNLLGGYEYHTDVIYQYYSPDYTIDGNTHYAIYRVFFQTNDQPGYLHFRFKYNPDDIYGSRFQLHGIRLRGYIGDPSSPNYQAQLLQSFNLARLADLINLDSSDVDLTTLESTTASILQKLANVPDIINYIDNLETIDTNILNAINTFLSYWNSTYNYYTDINRISFYNQTISINPAFNFTFTDVYFYFPYSKLNSDGIISLSIYFGYDIDPADITFEYAFGGRFDSTVSSLDYFDRFEFYSVDDLHIFKSRNSGNDFIFTNFYFHIPFEFSNLQTQNVPQNVILHLKKVNGALACYGSTLKYKFEPNNQSYFEYIKYYLYQLVHGNGSTVPSGIQQTTDTVTEQVTDIVEFEDTYNTSLENSASQIDVSSYEIQQTQGMSFMRTYTELNFDRMQNFRILFLTPLILALAAFFLRRKT